MYKVHHEGCSYLVLSLKQTSYPLSSQNTAADAAGNVLVLLFLHRPKLLTRPLQHPCTMTKLLPGSASRRLSTVALLAALLASNAAFACFCFVA